MENHGNRLCSDRSLNREPNLWENGRHVYMHVRNSRFRQNISCFKQFEEKTFLLVNKKEITTPIVDLTGMYSASVIQHLAGCYQGKIGLYPRVIHVFGLSSNHVHWANVASSVPTSPISSHFLVRYVLEGERAPHLATPAHNSGFYEEPIFLCTKWRWDGFVYRHCHPFQLAFCYKPNVLF